jgi:hydroxymethylpyrimidine/phosphomethylpyrimidine kinase
MSARVPPVVLIVAGNDPSGGAGITADIQTVTALGAHPAPVIAVLTVQDTVNARRVQPVSPDWVAEQMRSVLADMPVAAVKLGLLTSADTAATVARVLAEHALLSLVVDPVLTAGGGAPLAEEALIEAYLQELTPHATVVTPNAAEIRRLAPREQDIAARAAILLKRGAQHVLVKGADQDTPEVHNTLFSHDGGSKQFTWPRLPGRYHGSGCTLASAIAAHLALGHAVPDAVEKAQAYTWRTLQQGWRLGQGQLIPNRGTT